jgi:diadenosine tetraphosphate (Ap4A) HIT family hydrolase
MPSDFKLDPQIEALTMPLGRFKLSRVLLMNDSRYPWLLLVPEKAGIFEIIELKEAEQLQLMREIASASRVLQAVYQPDKLNVGALGNIVRQLHVHIQARFLSDATWPGPVWGVGQAVPYPPHMAGVIIDRLITGLKAEGLSE